MEYIINKIFYEALQQDEQQNKFIKSQRLLKAADQAVELILSDDYFKAVLKELDFNNNFIITLQRMQGAIKFLLSEKAGYNIVTNKNYKMYKHIIENLISDGQRLKQVIERSNTLYYAQTKGITSFINFLLILHNHFVEDVNNLCYYRLKEVLKSIKFNELLIRQHYIRKFVFSNDAGSYILHEFITNVETIISLFLRLQEYEKKQYNDDIEMILKKIYDKTTDAFETLISLHKNSNINTKDFLKNERTYLEYMVACMIVLKRSLHDLAYRYYALEDEKTLNNFLLQQQQLERISCYKENFLDEDKAYKNFLIVMKFKKEG